MNHYVFYHNPDKEEEIEWMEEPCEFGIVTDSSEETGSEETGSGEKKEMREMRAAKNSTS